MNIRQLFGNASDLAAIRSLMMRYKVAIDQADLTTVMECHASCQEISAVTLDSIYFGRKEVERFFIKLFSPALREGRSRPPENAHVSIQGDTAVLIFQNEMHLLQPRSEKLLTRISFTLVRENKEWRILSSHLSSPRTAFVDVGDAQH